MLSVQWQLVSNRCSEPKSQPPSGHDCATLGQCGGASLLADFATDEGAFLAEGVVDLGVDRAEFLQGLHPAEALHRPLSSSEWQM